MLRFRFFLFPLFLGVRIKTNFFFFPRVNVDGKLSGLNAVPAANFGAKDGVVIFVGVTRCQVVI